MKQDERYDNLIGAISIREEDKAANTVKKAGLRIASWSMWLRLSG